MAMAYRISSFIDTSDWLPVRRDDASFGDHLTERFTAIRPYFNNIITFNQPAPPASMTLHQWAQPAVLSRLFARYSDHIYRNNPEAPIEYKPLKSLWAQWYIGLLIPPLVMIALTERRALDISPALIRVEFHETGRASHFWINAKEDRRAGRLAPQQRLEMLWMGIVAPLITALERSGDINGKLIWNNTGHLVNWLSGELRPLIGDTLARDLSHACFSVQTLGDGSPNPLYRTMILRENLRVRRTCCQRNRLPGVQQCGDCTLNK